MNKAAARKKGARNGSRDDYARLARRLASVLDKSSWDEGKAPLVELFAALLRVQSAKRCSAPRGT